jgi:hypothetical protein
MKDDSVFDIPSTRRESCLNGIVFVRKLYPLIGKEFIQKALIDQDGAYPAT